MKPNSTRRWWAIGLLAYGVYLIVASVIAPNSGFYKGVHFDAWQGIVAGLIGVVAGIWGLVSNRRKRATELEKSKAEVGNVRAGSRRKFKEKSSLSSPDKVT